MKKDNKYNSSIRLSEQNYKYITKKASELGISQNALMNILLNLGSKVLEIKNLSDLPQNLWFLSK